MRAETVTQVNDSSGYAFTLFAGEYKTCSFAIDTNAQSDVLPVSVLLQQSADKLPACEPGG